MKTSPPEKDVPTIKSSSVASNTVDTTLATNQRHISEIFKVLELHGEAISRLAEFETRIIELETKLIDKAASVEEEDKTSSVSMSELHRNIMNSLNEACTTALPKSSDS